MKNRLVILIRQFKVFWKLRTLLKKIEFLIIKYFLQSKISIEETSLSANIKWQLIKTSIWPMLKAITASFLLYWLNKKFSPYYPEAITTDKLLDSYTSLLGTIAGVGGIFIGLYYAGLTSAGSSIYSTVPNNIRNLLARERRGATYMNFLSFMTFLSLSLIIFNFLGFGAGRLGAVFAVFLAGVGIFIFVHLGKLAFNYFDPSILAEPFYYDLRNFVNKITCRSYFYNNQSVQNHFNKEASATIDTLKTLTEIIEKPKHLNGKSYLELSGNILNFLVFYQKQKQYIPTKSYWYRIKYKHQDWYKSDSSSIEIAQKTGTLISPKNVQENNWLEDELIEIPLNCFRINLTEKRHEIVLSLIRWFKFYLKELIKHGEVKKALEIYKNLIKLFLENTKIDTLKYADSLENIAAFENLTSIKIDLLITYSMELSKITSAVIAQQLEKIDWFNVESVYNSNFPTYLLSDIEWLQKSISFEIEAEGKVISPYWYQKELITLWHSKKIMENINAFVHSSNTIRGWILKNVPIENNPWLASCFLSREMEYFNKLKNRIKQFEEYWPTLVEKHRIEKLPWPVVDFDKLNVSINNQYQAFLKHLPEATNSLNKKIRTDELPDYFGQFLFGMGEAVFNSAANNENEIAKEIFPGFFTGSLSKFTQIFPDASIPSWQFDNAFLIACGPILDLIELSGYTKLFSEYYKRDDLWEKVKQTWNLYLSENTQKKMEFMATLIRFEEQRPTISSSSLHRTGWSQSIFRLFSNEIDLISDDRSKGRGQFAVIGYETIALHESPLVRLFATDRFHSYYDGTDIFISEYFLTHPEAQKIEFQRKSKDLKDGLEREDKNTQFVKQKIKTMEKSK
jgi:hypothetical protein